MNRKQIALFIMLVLVATLFVTPFKKKVVADSPYQYEVISETDKTARLTHISSPGEKVVIPQSIDGYKIIEVGRFQKIALDVVRAQTVNQTIGNIFDSSVKQNVKEVVLPGSVLRIGNQAFYECNALSKINFPASLQHIGSEAFLGCVSLKEMNSGKNLKTIGYQAFNHCETLEKVVIRSDKVVVGMAAFGTRYIRHDESQRKMSPSKLTTIILPTKFSGELMADCFNSYMGTSFVWPDFSKGNLSEAFFRGAKNLNKISLAKTGKEVYIGKDALFTKQKIEKLTVPEKAKKVVFGLQSKLVDVLVIKGKNTALEISDSKSQIYNGSVAFSVKTVIAPRGSKVEKSLENAFHPMLSDTNTVSISYPIAEDSETLNKVEDINYIGVSLPSKPKVTLSGKKVKWTKTKKAEKYEIYYSAKKKGTYKLVATTKKTSYSLKKKGYVKVRAVRKTYDTDWRGDFSKVVKMK